MMSKICLFLILFAGNLLAFNWDKCKRGMGKTVAGLDFTTAYVGSSSSYFSSTGACSMIGINSHDRKVFIVFNNEKIIEDIMIGDGNHFSTFAQLSECSQKGKKDLVTELRTNYSKYFGDDLEYKPIKSLERIDEYILNNKNIECGHFQS